MFIFVSVRETVVVIPCMSETTHFRNSIGASLNTRVILSSLESLACDKTTLMKPGDLLKLLTIISFEKKEKLLRSKSCAFVIESNIVVASSNSLST